MLPGHWYSKRARNFVFLLFSQYFRTLFVNVLWCCGSGSEWIGIDFGWLDLDPYPGGHKCPTEVVKSIEISCFECKMFSFEG
jgi:hypothetical protein